MEFQALIRRAMDIRAQYAQLEGKKHSSNWASEEVALNFLANVWDLAKLIMARDGERHIPEVEQELAQQLTDCLASVIVLAEMNNIDLEQTLNQTMDELEQHLSSQM